MILRWFTQRLKKMQRERIYIVPSWKALAWTFFLFVLLAASVVSSKPEWITFPFVLFLVMLVMMFQSNRNLSKISFNLEDPLCLEESSKHWISIKVHNQSPKDKHAIYFRLRHKSYPKETNEIFVISNIRSGQRLTCSVQCSTPPPGTDKSYTLEVWSYAPIGMFYSWRNIKLEQVWNIYPKANFKETLLDLYEPMYLSHSTQKKDLHLKDLSQKNETKQEEFFEFVPLQVNSKENFDWKIFAKNRRLVKRKFETPSRDVQSIHPRIVLDLNLYLTRFGMDLDTVRFFLGDVTKVLNKNDAIVVKIGEKSFEFTQLYESRFYIAIAEFCEVLKRRNLV